MILIGVGANLPDAAGMSPRETCARALADLGDGVRVVRRSPWYRSAPVPVSDQPWFVNGVAELAVTDMGPEDLLARLHEVEDRFGRVRRARNEARVLDLDLLAWGDLVRATAPVLPHPRLDQRLFVLRPLRDLAPHWRHPVSGRTLDDMIATAPVDQMVEPLGEG